LLKSGCVEAIADLPKKAPSTQPQVEMKDVSAFLVDAANGQPIAKEVNARTRVLNFRQKDTEMLQCEDADGGWVHRNYLTKDSNPPQPPRQNGQVQFDGPQINAPVNAETPRPQR
jgi:hypothetical protein